MSGVVDVARTVPTFLTPHLHESWRSDKVVETLTDRLTCVNNIMLAVVLVTMGVISAPPDAPCVCAPTWTDSSTPNCGTRASAVQQHGCPTLEELQRCNPGETQRWCQTTELTCADQYGGQRGLGIMSMCDVTEPSKRAVIKGIAEGNKCMTWRNNNGTTELYDINILRKAATSAVDGVAPNWRTSNYFAYKHGKTNSDDQDYYLNVCGGLADYPDDGQNAAGPVAAYEEMPNNVSDITHVLARFGSNTNLTVVKDNDLRLRMGDGDESDHHDPNCPERSVDIIFFCAETDCGTNPQSGGLGSPVFVDEFKKCEYVFVWNTCAACPVGHPARENCGRARRSAGASAPGAISTMSPGGVLLITVAVLFSVYLVAGFAYNRFVNGERGLNQIPHYEFWSGFFNNVSAAPGAIAGLFIGKPKPSSISQNFNSGLLDDEDDEDELEDAEDKSYSYD